METEFILSTEKLQPTARERWELKIPAILEQAKVEAIHKSSISDILQEFDDDSEAYNKKKMKWNFREDILILYVFNIQQELRWILYLQ